MQEIKNKAGEILGTYEQTEIVKADTYTASYVDKAGNEKALTKEVTKDDILKLATQQFNTNVRNFVAGLARVGKPSKLKAFEAYFAEKGIDVTGVDTDKLIAKLKEMA